MPKKPRAGEPVLAAAAYRFPDFCKRYAIGQTKGREEITAGRLRARQVGRYIIITEIDAQAWLKSLPIASRYVSPVRPRAPMAQKTEEPITRVEMIAAPE